MAVSVQVLTPEGEDTTLDDDYYLNQHMAIVGDVIGEHIESTLVTKGLAGGPGAPAGYHAIATIVFANQSALDAALASVDPALEDIPNFTNTQPQMLIGEVVG
jgi:uncharacterized protein (TIGR02118 family)